MDDYTENRFGYLREKSTEELKDLIEQLTEDIENFKYDFETTKNGDQRTEAHHEINNATDKLNYIETILEDRQSTRTR